MNNSYNAPREIAIDLVDLLWKLLMQWKAILIVCIAMALLIPGAKYAKDTKAYKMQLADKRKAEEEASKPADVRIADALDLLPEADRQAVLFVVQQQEMVDMQMDYLENSIWINTDPASQRQLSIKYLLKSNGIADMSTLADSYNTCLRRNAFLKDLRDMISPDTKLEYINELINTNNDSIEAENTNSAIFAITIILPEDTDSDAVSALVDSTINDLHSELVLSVGEHSLSKTNTENIHVYNSNVIDRRASIIYTINNLNSSIDGAKGKLSPEQQAAAETIIAINQASDTAQDALPEDDTSSDPEKPVFSKKYAVLGFLFGAFLYAGIYVVILILKKVVSSAGTAQSYTGARLLGEVYKIGEHKGFSKLFVSDMVARWRYKDKLNADKQIDALASTVDAVCSHHGTDNLTLLLSGISTGFDKQLEQIVSKCISAGNKKNIDVLNTDEMDEKALTSVKNTVYVVSSMSKVDNLGSLMSLIRDYDVTPLGTIYLEKL